MEDELSEDLPLREEEQEAVKEAAMLSPRLIFEAIRRNGEEELQRPVSSTWNSGVMAGMLISFSVLGEAVLRAHLPDADWAYIVENFGYSFGFLLVVLGRMQLFTENTITTVVPVMLSKDWRSYLRTGRLWSVVLLANVVGAFIVAAFYVYAPVLSDEVRTAMMELSHHATSMPPFEGMMRGIPAGVLIAALVWMLPVVEHSEVPVIILFTWLIALGDFTHIVAGSVEMAFLVVQGELGARGAVLDFFLPVLAGNVLGGTMVFTMLAWGQIRPEVEEKENDRQRSAR